MEVEYKYEIGDTGYVLFRNKIRVAKINSLTINININLNFDGQYIQRDLIDNTYHVEFEDYDEDALYEIPEDQIYKTKEDLINDLRKKYGK